MIQYVKRNVPLISKELLLVDDVEAFVDRTDYSVIGAFISATLLSVLCCVPFLCVFSPWRKKQTVATAITVGSGGKVLEFSVIFIIMMYVVLFIYLLFFKNIISFCLILLFTAHK